MLPQKSFKIRMLKLVENEFLTTKFPDFSLTFLVFNKFSASKFPDISRFPNR